MADLITLEEYKAYKGIGKIDNDDKITFLIKSVSALIKAFCGHGIIDNWDEPVVEEISLPYDSHTLYLEGYPIREIISVEEVLSGWVAGLDSTIHYPAIFNSDFTMGDGFLRRIGRTWARNVKVTYTTGYETTPQQVKLAAIELVSYYFNEEWKPTRVMQGTTMVGPAPEANGIPKHISAMLVDFKVGR